MIWYGIEPLVDQQPADVPKLLLDCRIPLVRQNLVRCYLETDPGEKKLATMVDALGAARDPEVLNDLGRGTLLALEGRRSVPRPANWPVVYKALSTHADPQVQDHATALAVKFDDAIVIAGLREQLSSKGQEFAARERAGRSTRRSRAIDRLGQQGTNRPRRRR